MVLKHNNDTANNIGSSVLVFSLKSLETSCDHLSDHFKNCRKRFVMTFIIVYKLLVDPREGQGPEPFPFKCLRYV